MRNFATRLVITALAVAAAAFLLPGIRLTGGVGSALFVALVFGIVNALIRPVAMLFSIPLLILTLGLFTFVVNGLMLLLTAKLTSHLVVAGLWSAIWGSIVISLVSLALNRIVKEPDTGIHRHR
ncbi:MAG: phage holin family protein [Gemmatimonadota bacterium]|nr:phage holin family protein [Gemmatimonadota bacterium]